MYLSFGQLRNQWAAVQDVPRCLFHTHTHTHHYPWPRRFLCFTTNLLVADAAMMNLTAAYKVPGETVGTSGLQGWVWRYVLGNA